jgi:hypothetical protein
MPPARIALALLLFSLAAAHAEGFCPDGTFQTTTWPNGVRPQGIVALGSFCGPGDGNTGAAASKEVPAGSYLSAYLAGYPGLPGVELWVENVRAQERVPVKVDPLPREKWTLLRIPLPSKWKGQGVRIVAKDCSTGPGGWIAFSEPIPDDGLGAQILAATRLLAVVLFCLLILFIPAVAGCLIAAVRGIRDPLDLVAAAALTPGLIGYLAFWAYFANRAVGITYSFTVLAASAIIVIRAFKEPFRTSLSLLRPLLIPALLVAIASVFMVSLGYLHGGHEAPDELAQNRFVPQLPADNTLPELFADGIASGHIPKPLFGDWLSSDRPPLQTGMLLYSFPFLPGSRELQYQTLSMVLQCLFLASLWAFLKACRCSDSLAWMTLSVTAFSGFTFVNTFYTWPKLFPVSFLLVAMAYLLTDRFSKIRHGAAGGVITGTAAALALLCHGGSMFALLGIGLTLLLLRRHPSARWLAGMAVAAFAIYAPWIVYQRVCDPPGDRLIKMHLAGVSDPRPEAPFSHLLFENYANLRVRELIHNKVENFKVPVGDPAANGNLLRVLITHLFDSDTHARNAAAASLRLEMFFRLLPCIGLAALAPLLLPWLLLSKRSRRDVLPAASMLACAAITIVVWCLLMFGPSATFIHQGTYLVPVLAMSGAYLVFWAARPGLAIASGAAQMLFNAVLFIWLTPASEIGVGIAVGPINMALLAACMASGFHCEVRIRRHSGRGQPITR